MNILIITLFTLTTFRVVICQRPYLISMRTAEKLAHNHAEPCTAFLVESIPEGLTYPPASPRHISTVFAWDMLIYNARQNISIASFYWSLLGEDICNSSSAYQVSKCQKIVMMNHPIIIFKQIS